jgi:hypothetical protein
MTNRFLLQNKPFSKITPNKPECENTFKTSKAKLETL